MIQILLYSGLLVFGMAVSQLLDLSGLRPLLVTVTMVCLAYIMVEVGLEFTLDKKRLKSYGWDYVVAMIAAAFPWIFCAAYFMAVFQTPWKEALLIGRFAAPTSAGVLFAMLAAAGLGTTWLFRKAQVLAIFDDLDTVLLMIPLQFLLVGFKAELLAVVLFILILFGAAYRWLHAIRWPISKGWLLLYGAAVVLLCQAIERTVHVHLEVLLPAFALGCVLVNPHDPNRPREHPHEHAYLEPEQNGAFLLDRVVKALFMFLVGCSLPRIALGTMGIAAAIWHVVALTLLANLGKCFPAFCYRREAPLPHRLALSIAMFPRGEVGAGVLLVAIVYGLVGLPVTLGGLSLAVNLALTGAFIAAVKWLLRKGGMPRAA
ncbi:MAG: cation:proton antiporter [Candidatus Omnitrophica bacterium]|nr:cation:proton antiporter [Candidatus Omnitrophota bacterium]